MYVSGSPGDVVFIQSHVNGFLHRRRESGNGSGGSGGRGGGRTCAFRLTVLHMHVFLEKLYDFFLLRIHGMILDCERRDEDEGFGFGLVCRENEKESGLLGLRKSKVWVVEVGSWVV